MDAAASLGTGRGMPEVSDSPVHLTTGTPRVARNIRRSVARSVMVVMALRYTTRDFPSVSTTPSCSARLD